MPIYTYAVVQEDGSLGEPFDVVRSMSEPPLTHHPETGEPVRRIYKAPNIAGQWGESASKERLSDANLAKHGFTKYQRVGKGKYERRTGSGGPPKIDMK